VSIRELEAATGIHRTTLSMLEKGRYLPTPDEAGKIMAELSRLRAERIPAATINPSATIEG
jgi:DNA-binding XRE family transcriptional regulator